MKNLSLKALTAVCEQKKISVPEFPKGTTTDQKKEALQKLIEGAEKPSKPGKTFDGES